jgi:hypothetical protein
MAQFTYFSKCSIDVSCHHFRKGSSSLCYSYCVACIRLYCIGPCQVQQRGTSRAQIQHEGGSRVFYFKHALVHGYHLYLMPLFSEAGDWKTSVDPLPPTSDQPGLSPPLPLGVPTPPPAKMKVRPASVEITLQPLIRGLRPQIGREEDVETILGFSARLYKVRELSWSPAQVEQRASA